jgi:hypothetical protein
VADKFLILGGQAYIFLLDDDYDNKVEYNGEEYLTTAVVASEGDETFFISNVKEEKRQ